MVIPSRLRAPCDALEATASLLLHHRDNLKFSALVIPSAVHEMVKISHRDPVIGFVNGYAPALPLWRLLPIRTRPIDGPYFFADRVFGSEIVYGSAAHRRHAVVINDQKSTRRKKSVQCV